MIGVAAACAAVGVWWLFWRVLPQTSGEAQAPVGVAVAVVRDGEGVPHIEAASVEDAMFAQGYVTAQDRLFQMELVRRLAAGEAAEVLGPAALESDVEMRRMRMRKVAESHARTMPAGDKKWFAHYARGVNHFLRTHRDKLPVEFRLLRYDPAPWTVTDSVLVSMQMARTLSLSMKEELLKRNMLAAGEPELVRELFPLRTGLEFQPGSNAWAVSGARTKSGKPLLAGDPHLAFSLPGIWYQVRLKAPGLDVAGVSLPGLPGVIIGHNERIAWSMTNLHFDVQDLYVEEMNPGGTLVKHLGKWVPVAREMELVRVKGAKDAQVPVAVTPHGPVVAQEGNQFLASRWMAAEAGTYQYPVIEVNQARNWEEFRKALRRFVWPAQNLIYADREGNIGFQAAGLLPVRENFDGDVPVEGGEGKYEWKGTIPFEELPWALNPAGGAVISGNQNPFPADYRYRVSGYFAPHYRANQIRDRLAKREKWDAEGFVSVQRDVYSSLGAYLAKELARVAKGKEAQSPLLGEANAALEKWNGQMEVDAAGAVVATLAYQHLRKAVVERAAPGKAEGYGLNIATAVVERLLRQRPKEWFQDYDGLLLRAYVDALEEGSRMFGKDVRRWRYGWMMRLRMANPVLGEMMGIGRYASIGPAEMAGNGTTVQQIGGRVGPSMRMVADLGDWERSTLTTTTGQSGQPLSGRYRDRWKVYYGGGAIPWRYGKVEGDRLVLKPN